MKIYIFPAFLNLQPRIPSPLHTEFTDFDIVQQYPSCYKILGCIYMFSLFQCMISLQGCPLPEAAEILDILNRIEFEALFYSHDKLADLQEAYTSYL